MQQVIKGFEGLKIGVIGLGRTGISSIRALLAGNAIVIAMDDQASARERLYNLYQNNRNEADLLQQNLLIEPCDLDNLKGLSALVISPGIKKSHPLIKTAIDHNIKILGDIDLLYMANPDAYYIGITGTNGKSTTTALIAHCLTQFGYKVAAGGNLGVAALDLPILGKGGFYVLELSSYQLESIHKIQFEAAILLNITPDHLDYHGTMANYAAAKAKLFKHLKKGGLAAIGTDEPETQNIYNELSKDDDKKIVALNLQITPKSLDNLEYLPGSHNQQNIKAAIAVASYFKLKQEDIISFIKTYPGLEHRLQKIKQVGSIGFYNDSKATNPESAAKALACFKHIYWIAGGRSKQAPYETLLPFLMNIKAAYLIGEAAKEIEIFIDQNQPSIACYDMDRLGPALEKAWGDARKDGLEDAVILLSPACASFDQYHDFEERGRDFVKKIDVISAAHPEFLIENTISMKGQS